MEVLIENKFKGELKFLNKKETYFIEFSENNYKLFVLFKIKSLK